MNHSTLCGVQDRASLKDFLEEPNARRAGNAAADGRHQQLHRQPRRREPARPGSPPSASRRWGSRAEFVPSTNREWGDHLVLTRRGRSAKSIALVSHLDTVFPPEEEARNNFHWLRGGRPHLRPGHARHQGRHRHDVAHAVRAAGPCAQGIRGHHLEADLELLRGVLLAGLRRRLPRATSTSGTLAALVFESEGRAGKASLHGRGAQRPRHVAGHGQRPRCACGRQARHGANAIVQLGRTVQRIAALTDYARGLTVNVGTIRGGTVLNRVPHEAVAEGEFRTFTPEAYAHAQSRPAGAGRARARNAARGRLCLRGQGRDSHRVPPLAAQPGHRRALPALEASR